jgi:hypothetical protein
MAIVYIEAQPKGRPDGTRIDDYVIEDYAITCRPLSEHSEKQSIGQKCSIGRSCPTFEWQEEARSRAVSLKAIAKMTKPRHSWPGLWYGSGG